MMHKPPASPSNGRPDEREPDEADPTPFLERLGVSLVARQARRLPPLPPEDAVHVLDRAEAGDLKRITHGAVFRSAMAGALSALVAAGGVGLAESLVPLGDDPSTTTLIQHWGLALGIAAVAAIIEIVYLYWDALRSVVLMARAAGLSLLEAEQEDTRHALARAALELENPAEPVEGIDPLREASRWRLLVYSLLYKGKIAATSFLLKAIVRRALGRAALRGWLLELVAVPVTALWNALVTWLVMREASMRVLGPSAATALTDELWQLHSPDSPQREAALRAVGSAIVRSADLHPNLLALLRTLQSRSDGPVPHDAGDSRAFLDAFRAASEADQRWMLAVVTLAASIDGRLSTAERRLLVELRRAAGLPDSIDSVETLTQRLRRGERVRAPELFDAAGTPLQ